MPHRVFVTARWLDLPRLGAAERPREALLDATGSLAALGAVRRFTIEHTSSPDKRVRALGADGAVPLHEATSDIAASDAADELVATLNGHRKLVVSGTTEPRTPSVGSHVVYFIFWV